MDLLEQRVQYSERLPGREKFGYGADLVTTAEAFCYNYDMSSFYRKVIQDFVNDRRPMEECRRLRRQSALRSKVWATEQDLRAGS